LESGGSQPAGSQPREQNAYISASTRGFQIQDQGTLRGSTVSGDWFVVPGSGTGELAGMRGDGGFSAELGQGAEITLDYWFE
jgi:hypothetical protein